MKTTQGTKKKTKVTQSNNKKMLVYHNDESQLYFDGDVCVGAVSGNDGDWRHEYFNPIVAKFGLVVEDIEELNEAQLKSAKSKFSNHFIDQ